MIKRYRLNEGFEKNVPTSEEIYEAYLDAVDHFLGSIDYSLNEFLIKYEDLELKPASAVPEKAYAEFENLLSDKISAEDVMVYMDCVDPYSRKDENYERCRDAVEDAIPSPTNILGEEMLTEILWSTLRVAW